LLLKNIKRNIAQILIIGTKTHGMLFSLTN